jgi:hypothetical protein
MNIPEFSAHVSIYRTSNRYVSSVAEFGGPVADQSVAAAYIPGPQTQHDCSVCTDACAVPRDICLAKVAVSVTEACWGSLGFGCGAAVAWGYFESASCYVPYEACLGYCNIPGGLGPLSGPCCPKVCGPPNPFEGSGSGCCDHGEACVGSHNPNTRDGCCPVGQECHGNCCAKGEYCLDGGVCSTDPGTFGNTPPPPPPQNNCIFGGAPCGSKCCPPGLACCGVFSGQPDCRRSCLR